MEIHYRFRAIYRKTLFFFILLSSLSAVALANEEPSSVIKGKVVTSDGQPAALVSVQIKGKNRGTVTDNKGEFTFRKVQAGKYTLQVSLIGYETIEQEVEVGTEEVVAVVLQIQASDKQLEEVMVVSGLNKFGKKESDFVARLPLKNSENPQVYNVITKDLMREQMVVNFDDAIKNAPGVNRLWSSTGRPNDGAGFFSMRGFSVQPTMINGIPGLTNGSIDPANIERIEAIKGPSGTLFGSSLISFGGLLNIVTKKPYETFGGEVSYTGGGFGLSRITADINAPLNQEKTALLRVNSAYHYEGSFQDAGFRRSLFLAPSLSYKVNDKLSFFVNTEFYNAESTNTLMVFLNRTRGLIARTPKELGIDFTRSFTSNDITYKTPTVNLFGQVSYKLSGQWTSQTNLSRSVRKSDGYYSYVMFLDQGTGTVPPTINDTLLSRFVYNQNSTSVTTDIQQNFIGDFNILGHRNRVVAGLDFMQIETTNNNSPFALFDYVSSIRKDDPRYSQLNRQAVDAKLAQLASGNTRNIITNYTYSAYVSDVFNITDDLIAMLSLRVDHFDNKGTKDTKTGVINGKFSQTSLSPKFGLVYQPVKDKVSVFANYMNGFRNSDPVPGNAAAGYPTTFDPQQAIQKEGGVKLDVLNHRLSVTASYYDILVTNIKRGITVNNLNVTIQDGSQVSRGVELDVIANPLPGLNVIAGYSYNHSKVVKAADATKDRRPNTAGPANLASFWVSYTTPSGKLQGLGVGFGGNYSSDNIITSTLATGNFILPSYTVFNSTIFYNTNSYRLALKADNIADKEYFGGWTTVERQMPRRFSASIAFKF